MRAIWPGKPYPLGASFDGLGVNFALFSRNATRVELCLFDSTRAQTETERIEVKEQTDMVWHCYVPDLKPGQLYGFRVHGPHDPWRGHRFNPNKVVLDPYAKAIGRDVAWDDSMFGYRIGDSRGDLSLDSADNAAFAPLAAVIDSSFAWEDDAPPRRPWHDTVIYELHVKGFTKLHPDLPEKLRGTYAGLASEPAIRHLKSLGITAVELLPVHHHLDDRHLVERGLSNYWGYNTLSFFSPDCRYASDQANAAREFKQMVKALHAAGIEVILDVVYNHTAEGNHMGPTLSFRGIDNQAYYRLVRDNARYYEDFTGTGNSMNMREPRVLQLIMDSLRYWVQEMHVDGFRFDLASTLARELYEVDNLSAFFDIIHQDPLLSQVKLIAEPWDLGQGGYQVGNFPVGWAEWNGRYRDAIRSFWKGDAQGMSEIATRLSGSSDLYERTGRKPYASINFVTCHDGFTLQDLVSYNGKHNEANGEGNRDGTDDNRSWNCGAEGPTDDPAILDLRERQKRNLMSTLLLSQGVPMICGGDELSRSQMGNNNAYCQDNELSWVSWALDARQQEFLEFVRGLIRLRQTQAVLRRRKFFQGRSIRGVKDIAWLSPDGREMTDEAWSNTETRSLAIRLSGDALDEVDERGRPVAGDTLLVLINASHEPETFEVAPPRPDGWWEAQVETAPPSRNGAGPGHWSWELGGRTVAVFRLDARGGSAAPLETGEEGLRALQAARQAVRRVLEASVWPVSTYRVQLTPGFGFESAAALADYFQALGVDAVYLSPILKAVPGSPHGYNVVDPTSLNPELGGAEGFDRLAAASREAGLKLVVDIVPNHMGIDGGHNALWRDVLERGQDSPYASFFDIDWAPTKPELRGKVLLPVLGDLYGRVLESGKLTLAFEEGRFELELYGVRYPVAARSYPLILEHGFEDLERDAPGDVLEFRAIAALAGGGDGASARRRLAALVGRSPAVRAHVEARVKAYNGAEGRKRSFDLLDALLARQHYRLAFWRVASDEINYRRFFNINELAAVRVEQEPVFDFTHRLLLRLVGEGKLQGLRIDHSDGLYDPSAYFRRLQERFLQRAIPGAEASPAAVARVLSEPEFARAAPLYVVAEKVLDRTEALREDWRIHGTVGYDALNLLGAVQIDRDNETAMDAVYEGFIGHKIEIPRLIRDAKRRFIRSAMSSEVESLGHRLDTISETSREYRDFTRASLTAALREVIDCFPVYRTYVSPDSERVDARDEMYVTQAVEDAKRSNPRLQPEVFDFIREVLLLHLEKSVSPEERALYRDFVLRFQQVTGSVMAKGVEDTAFYIDNRLLSLNEVGGDPARFGCSLEEFHAANADRAKRWPKSMVATSTHDTKRSEDVRARLNALSELPMEWKRAVEAWARANRSRKTEVSGALEPRPNTEWFVYQTLIGAWPDGPVGADFKPRMLEHVLKSIREAKVRTDWTDPNAEYEKAVQDFTAAILDEPEDGAFKSSFLPLQRRVSWLGKLNSLAALALKLGGPGVADTYQGCELWDYSLVDPDNRRPVDWQARRAALAALESAVSKRGRAAAARALLERPDDGLIKLFVVREALQARRRLRDLFVGGGYEPLETTGTRAAQLVAFARRFGGQASLVAAGRFFARFPEFSMPLGRAWGDAAVYLPEGLDAGRLVDVFTGERIPVESVGGRKAAPAEALFASLPAALGVNEP